MPQCEGRRKKGDEEGRGSSLPPPYFLGEERRKKKKRGITLAPPPPPPLCSRCSTKEKEVRPTSTPYQPTSPVGPPQDAAGEKTRTFWVTSSPRMSLPKTTASANSGKNWLLMKTTRTKPFQDRFTIIEQRIGSKKSTVEEQELQRREIRLADI